MTGSSSPSCRPSPRCWPSPWPRRPASSTSPNGTALLDRLPRRRRGRDRQSQRAADDEGLPRGGRRCAAQLPAARRGRRRDRHRRRRRPGLLGRFSSASTPAASRVTRLAAETPASFIAFDLLALGGADLTSEPFTHRRAALEQALASAAPPIHVTPLTRDETIARAWFDRFEGAGVMADRQLLDLTYEPDKRVMTKIKHVRTADCVVAGYRIHRPPPPRSGRSCSASTSTRRRRGRSGTTP